MDIIQEIQQMIMGNARRDAFLNLGSEEKLRQIKEAKMHGTTILALKCKEGVIIAGDRRCVAGNTIFSDEMLKIEKISELSCMAGAGWVSDFQILAELLRDNLIPYFEKLLEKEIFIGSQSKLLKHAIRNVLYLTWPILAGWDPYQKAGRIFLYEPSGTIYELPYFAATGSGEGASLETLRSGWSKDMSVRKGIELSVEAILASSKVDPNTSSPLLSSPIVKIITSEKIIDAGEKGNYKIAWNKHLKTLARRGEKQEFTKIFTKTKTSIIPTELKSKKNEEGK